MTDVHVSFVPSDDYPGWYYAVVEIFAGTRMYNAAAYGERPERAVGFALEKLGARLLATYPREKD